MTRPASIAAACPNMSEAVRRLNAEIVSPRNIRVPLSAIPGVTSKPAPTMRQKRTPRINKTEAAFAALLRSEHAGHVVREQSITLILANGVRYTPDICVDGVDFYEVKGFMRDDAAVKLKVAASQFTEYRFHLVTRQRGGGWRIEEVLA